MNMIQLGLVWCLNFSPFRSERGDKLSHDVRQIMPPENWKIKGESEVDTVVHEIEKHS